MKMIPEELVELSADLKPISHELWEIKRDLAWNRVIDDAIRVCRALGQREAAEARKYREDQPRVPAGNQDGGQWTDAGSGTGNTGAAGSDEGRVISDANPDNFWKPGAQYAQAQLPPSNDGGPPNGPPKIPEKRPLDGTTRNSIIKLTARWLVQNRDNIEATRKLFETVGWAYVELWPSVQSYFAPPRSLESLQRSNLPTEAGYNDHHNVEQTSARRSGFPLNQIHGRENVLRIPTLKHWRVTAEYNRIREELGDKSARQYLSDKSWQEREEFGYKILIKEGILKP